MKLSLLSTGAEISARFIEHVKLAELLGFHAFLHSDGEWTRDGMSRLGAASQCTTKLGLGVWVGDPPARHPASLARAAATLAEMAPGRLRVVMGSHGGFAASAGIANPNALAALREAADLLRRLWRGETVAVDGEAVKFKGGPLAWKPAAVPQLYLAGFEPQVLKLAGSLADGVVIDGLASPPSIEQARQHILAGLQAAGRGWKDVTLCCRIPVCLLEREGDPVPEAISREAAHASARSPGKPAGEIIGSFAVVGTGEQVRERFKALAAAGIYELVISPVPAPGQDAEDVMFRLVKDVMPHVTEAAAGVS